MTVPLELPPPICTADYCPICGNKPGRNAVTFAIPGRKSTRGPGGAGRYTIVFKLCNKRCMVGFINFVTLVAA